MIVISYKHERVFGWLGERRKFPRKGKPETGSLKTKKSASIYHQIWARGGKTTCYISNRHTDADGLTRDDILATGEALCSMGDNFCYRKGRGIAFMRALLACPKEHMPAVYQEYHGGSLDFSQFMVNKLLEEREKS